METIKTCSVEDIKIAMKTLKVAIKEAATLPQGTVMISALRDVTKIQVLNGSEEVRFESYDVNLKQPFFSYLRSCANEYCAKLLGLSTKNGEKSDCDCFISDADNVLYFIFKEGHFRSVISEIKVISKQDFLAKLALTPQMRSQLEAIIQARSGLIIASSCNEVQTKAVQSMLLALSPAIPVGEVTSDLTKRYVLEHSKDELLVATLQAVDPLTPLLKLRESDYAFNKLNLVGSLTAAFANKTCSACAREAVCDPKWLEDLPAVLRPEGISNYQIGRGCPQCEQRGYYGYVYLMGIIVNHDNFVLNKLKDNIKEATLLESVYDDGAITLLQDGLNKIEHGEIAFESLHSIVRLLPEVYTKLLCQRALQTFNAESLEVQQALNVAGNKNNSKNQKRQIDARKIYKTPRANPLLLVAEDDADQMDILLLVLKAAGYEVKSAANGKEAFELAKKILPDLILTDLMMPEMDGAALVQALRESPSLNNIPVMVLTVSTDLDKEYQLLDLGADDYCEKTVQRKVLLKRIENLLRRAAD